MDPFHERFACTYRHPASGDVLTVRLQQFATGDADDAVGWRVLAEYSRGGDVGGAAVPIHESGRLETALRALNGELEVYGEEGFRDAVGQPPARITPDDLAELAVDSGGITLD